MVRRPHEESNNGTRLIVHPILGAMEKREEVNFTFDGQKYKGLAGEPIAAALLAAGVRRLRCSEISGEPRGVFCSIGHCYECRVTVNGRRSVRSCITPLKEGMVIESQEPVAADTSEPKVRSYHES